MTAQAVLDQIPGMQAVVAHFGSWPSFHDAEVIGLELRRNAPSHLDIHAFSTTAATDSHGRYITSKHAVVQFTFQEVTDCELYGFNEQNVLSGLELSKLDSSYKVVLGGCYGLQGKLVAKDIVVTLREGIPPDSTYLRSAGEEVAT